MKYSFSFFIDKQRIFKFLFFENDIKKKKIYIYIYIMNIISLKYWWSNNNSEFSHHCDRAYPDPLHIISYSWYIDGIRIIFDFFRKDEVNLDLTEIVRKFFHHHFYDYPYEKNSKFHFRILSLFLNFYRIIFLQYQDDFCDFHIVSSSWYENRLNFWIHDVIWEKTFQKIETIIHKICLS